MLIECGREAIQDLGDFVRCSTGDAIVVADQNTDE